MIDKNKAMSRRMLEEVFGGGKLDVIDELVAPNAIAHDAVGGDIRGPQGLRQFVTKYRSAFPDMQMIVEDQIAEGDKVITRWRCRGTHKGTLEGIAPTNRQVTVNGMTIDRIEGGKMVESWSQWDAIGMMRQLGVAPGAQPEKQQGDGARAHPR